MKAMLLAAGEGRRMWPLTRTLPKPALPVLGRPLALSNLGRLARYGVERAVVNLHHHAELLRGLLGPGGRDGLPQLDYTFEHVILGTGGGIRNAAALLRGDGAFLVHNADFLSDIDVEALSRAHAESGLAATLVLTAGRPGYSAVDVDREGRVVSIGGRPLVEPGLLAGSYLFTGCHLLDDSLLERLPAGGPSDIIADLYRGLAAEGQLGSYVHDGFWWEFGSPHLLLEGQLRLLDLPLPALGEVSDHDPVHVEEDGGRSSIGTDVLLDAGARLAGRCAVGQASRVGAGCLLEDSVVMGEARIGPGCRLRRVLVSPGTEVPGGFAAEAAVVCPDAGVEEGLSSRARRQEGLLVLPFGPVGA